MRLRRRPASSSWRAAGKLHAAIKATSGQTIEQLCRAMRMPTAALKLPAAKLIETKKFRTKVQKRGTRYFAA